VSEREPELAHAPFRRHDIHPCEFKVFRNHRPDGLLDLEHPRQ
jgi:hypothetical protein